MLAALVVDNSTTSIIGLAVLKVNKHIAVSIVNRNTMVPWYKPSMQKKQLVNDCKKDAFVNFINWHQRDQIYYLEQPIMNV